jgi:hypothetical protein
MALSDNDEEYNTFRLNDDDSPVKGHSRQGSASEGHLYAGRHSTAGLLHIALPHHFGQPHMQNRWPCTKLSELQTSSKLVLKSWEFALYDDCDMISDSRPCWPTNSTLGAQNERPVNSPRE